MKRSRDVRIDEDVDFESLVANKSLLKGLLHAGYDRPSPIQLQAIPLGRLGSDLIAQAKSGTGKTVVFSVIAIESIQIELKQPQVIMVAPTREIAIQIRDVVRNVGQHVNGFHCDAFIGGLSVKADVQKLQRCQIVVGTPGRLSQLINEKMLNVREIKLLVLDEADRLMSESFIKQVKYIHHKLPSRKQCIAFSATFSGHLFDMLGDFMESPQTVRLTSDDDNMFKQKLQAYKAKFEATADILSKIPFHQCMVFINSVSRAMELSEWLTEMGWMSGFISGGLTQEQRMKVMESMRDFKFRVLVCSDLIARGIDIDRVNLVINIEYPHDMETYMHRVGRTGRFGTSGIAVNLVGPGDEAFLDHLKSSGIHITPLPDNVSYSEFRKMLSDNEQKLLKNHEINREKQDERPAKFTKLDRKISHADNSVQNAQSTAKDHAHEKKHSKSQKAAATKKKTAYAQRTTPHLSNTYVEGSFLPPLPSTFYPPPFIQIARPPPQSRQQYPPPPLVVPFFATAPVHFIPPDLWY
ncbi:P-loop containing nucleoside triphosphate hydrolase protein [Dichotomocladium elegans]|nr:P-loop containing nucleoside triphosphate hydrolase protein [Dichotomocladium elegans]